MQIKKQFWGYDTQKVDMILADTQKQSTEEINKINNRIHDLHLKNHQKITELGILLQQVEECQEQELAITEQFLEQVRILADIRSQAELSKNAAQKELHLKLDELSDSYRIIDDIKTKLIASHKQLEYLKQTKSQLKLNQN